MNQFNFTAVLHAQTSVYILLLQRPLKLHDFQKTIYRKSYMIIILEKSASNRDQAELPSSIRLETMI